MQGLINYSREQGQYLMQFDTPEKRRNETASQGI